MNRVRLAMAIGGFAAAVLAVVTDDRRISWIAIALLSASLILRILQRKHSGEHRQDGADP
jgi:hypothetical protein